MNMSRTKNSLQVLDQNQLDNELKNAILFGNVDLLSVYLDHGANVNAKNFAGETTLMYAVDKFCSDEQKAIRVIKLLLEHDATGINIPDNHGCTPLMKAMNMGRKGIANLLIRYGAEINIPDKNGQTALMFSVELGSFPLVDLLIRYGAKIDAINEAGETALMIAADNLPPNPDIAKRLLWEMLPEERTAFSNMNINHQSVVQNFHSELKFNANKVLDFVKQSGHINPATPLLECDGVNLNLDILQKIELQMLKKALYSQDFPAWYRPCIETHLNEAIKIVNKYNGLSQRLPMVTADSTPSQRNYFMCGGIFFSGSTMLNQAKRYLKGVRANSMKIELPQGNNTQKMDIDEVETQGIKRKREEDDKEPNKKRFK